MREWEYVIVFLTEVKLVSEGSFHCDIFICRYRHVIFVKKIPKSIRAAMQREKSRHYPLHRDNISKRYE